jgi:putative ATP-binding cassette transporter
VFYTKLLPELRSRGKAVLVITHDDRYFSCADRLIRLDYGKITPSGPGGLADGNLDRVLAAMPVGAS